MNVLKNIHLSFSTIHFACFIIIAVVLEILGALLAYETIGEVTSSLSFDL